MAVRLRKINPNGGWIALCAAITKPLPGDVYVDDSKDHALRRHYIDEYLIEGLIDPDKVTRCKCNTCIFRPTLESIEQQYDILNKEREDENGG